MEGCRIIKFGAIGDKERGFLTVLEGNRNIPFDIKRVYYMYNVPSEARRGFHAHKKLEQILICIHGRVRIKYTDGRQWESVELTSPHTGLYMGPMIWHEMYDYSSDAVLMVLASDYYDERDYIRSFEFFLEYGKKGAEGKDAGDVFVHEKAIVETAHIGRGTRVWPFVHVLKGARIGENCNLCEHVFVENDVIIGNNVTIKCGVYIWDGLRIEDNVFIGPCTTFINDVRPRSKRYPDRFLNTYILEGSSLGANSTIMGGIKIGAYATVGAGSVVLRDVNDYEIVVGNPARFIGYNCRCGARLAIKENYCRCSCGLKYEIKEGKLEYIGGG